MRKFLFSCGLLLMALFGQSQNITVNFDFSNAKTTLQLLQQSSLDRSDLATFLSLPGTKALIKKINSHPDTAYTALTRAMQDLPSTQQGQNFGYRRVKREIDSLQAFIHRLEQQKSAITKAVIQALLPYAPAGKNMDITIYGTLGGYSSAYTLGDDSSFFLGLQFYKNDVNGVIELCKHELFHNIQSALHNSNGVTDQLEKQSQGFGYAHALLNYLFKEGTAEYVADLNKTDKTTPYIKELWEHMAVNNNRAEEAFYLFERSFLDVTQNPNSIDFNKTYNMLFSWQWNNPAYFVGYAMTKSLTAAYGENVLKKYLTADPTLFVLDYIKLTKNQKDLSPFIFSAAFEKEVQQLAAEAKNKVGAR